MSDGGTSVVLFLQTRLDIDMSSDTDEGAKNQEIPDLEVLRLASGQLDISQSKVFDKSNGTFVADVITVREHRAISVSLRIRIRLRCITAIVFNVGIMLTGSVGAHEP